jgi:predicted  nucleic acid-binding Zn-ribbon protein
MLCKCRNCGITSDDIDTVLNGSCKCGCSHFKLVSTDDKWNLPGELTTKEKIRRDLHEWIDLNVDSLSPEEVASIRVSVHVDDVK